MKTFLQKFKLEHIVIIVLFLVIALQRWGIGCGHPKQIVSHSDTTYLHDTTTMPGKLQHDTIHIPKQTGTSKPTVDIPIAAGDYADLVNQYNDLADSFYSYTYFLDSVKLKDDKFPGKDLGTVTIRDQINENHIFGRDISYQLKFPVINNTTTITNTVVTPPTRKFYVGLGLTGNKTDLISGAKAGIMYQTKKDHVYQIDLGLQKPPTDSKFYPQFGISTYWKIKLK